MHTPSEFVFIELRAVGQSVEVLMALDLKGQNVDKQPLSPLKLGLAQEGLGLLLIRVEL